MSKVTNSIGDWFEGFIGNRYSDLWDTRSDKLIPDFSHATYLGEDKWEEHFLLEAKVGNKRWGCRLKDYQIDSFGRYSNSII